MCSRDIDDEYDDEYDAEYDEEEEAEEEEENVEWMERSFVNEEELHEHVFRSSVWMITDDNRPFRGIKRRLMRASIEERGPPSFSLYTGSVFLSYSMSCSSRSIVLFDDSILGRHAILPFKL